MADNLDPDEVRSLGTGTVYIGAVGATEPDDYDATPDDAEWYEVGHISDAGPRFSFGKSRTPIRSWQSYPDPVRTLAGESINTIAADLLQWNRENFEYAMGGGDWTDDGGGLYTFEPADASEDNEKALIVEGIDGDYGYRFIFRRTEVQSNVEFAFTPTALAPLAITATVLAAPVGTKPWMFQTNDPAFVALGS